MSSSRHMQAIDFSFMLRRRTMILTLCVALQSGLQSLLQVRMILSTLHSSVKSVHTKRVLGMRSYANHIMFAVCTNIAPSQCFVTVLCSASVSLTSLVPEHAQQSRFVCLTAAQAADLNSSILSFSALLCTDLLVTTVVDHCNLA